MATAEKSPISTIVKHEVTLTLSEDEAATLSQILSTVGGDPRTTARRHADTIQEALKDVGFEYISSGRGGDLYPLERGARAAVYFEDDTLNMHERMVKYQNQPRY